MTDDKLKSLKRRAVFKLGTAAVFFVLAGTLAFSAFVDMQKQEVVNAISVSEGDEIYAIFVRPNGGAGEGFFVRKMYTKSGCEEAQTSEETGLNLIPGIIAQRGGDPSKGYVFQCVQLSETSATGQPA
jgi:hypothetical protein